MDDVIMRNLENLLILALENEISEDQTRELNDLLKNHPERIRFAIQFLQTASNLKHSQKLAGMSKFWLSMDSHDSFWNFMDLMAEHEKKAEAIEIAKSLKESVEDREPIVKRPPSTTQVSKFSIYSLILSSAALLFIIVYAHFAPATTAPLVGKLSQMVDAQWQDASGQINQGCDLYAGPMHLVKGYAEIGLDSGAQVIVQAPCRFTLESTQQLFLHEGQIVATMRGVSKQTFVVRTPHACMVDYGTEFGVKVDPLGQTETYVYEGQVQIRDSSDPVKFVKSLLLKTGQGAMADTESKLVSKKVNPKEFIRSEEMESRYQSQKGSHYHRWKSSVYRLHRDPYLVAHYFYEKQSDNPDQLVNAVFPDNPGRQGIFGDTNRSKPTWTQGRWPQKDAVRFDRTQKQAIVIPPDPSLSVTFPLTISTWLYFSNADQWGGHLISCREKERVNYQFSLFDKNYAYDYQLNRFEFRQYNESKGKGFYSEPFVPSVDTWYHFAVVYDGSELRFYVNGMLFQSTSYKGLPEAAPAEIIIGALKKGEYILEEGDFDGIVDELMLFNRCLSEQEIRTIYRDGKP